MEDDVLHFENLPSFGGILSSDESEILLSCLSVEHLRIPSHFGFLLAQDRYMHLFSVKLQNLLRAVLLEPGSFLPKSDFRDVEHIPLRMNAHQKEVLRQGSNGHLPQHLVMTRFSWAQSMVFSSMN
jgi:hypothetical protein